MDFKILYMNIAIKSEMDKMYKNGAYISIAAVNIAFLLSLMYSL
jgi:hypothetical protein